MADEWKTEFGTDRPAAVGELMRDVLDVQMARSMSDNQRAAFAWSKANGDRERKHTTGVFLKRPRVRGAAPILGVYVDSHAMATDFGVNKEIYLSRLANIGFEVSGIEFLPSRRRVQSKETTAAKPTKKQPEQLPELDAHTEREVEELVAQLPESLRDRASQAILISKRREKLENAKPAGNA